MIATIHPPITQEAIHQLRKNGWNIQDKIEPTKPLHLFAEMEYWCTWAIQDNARVASLSDITPILLPESWVSQESEAMITFARMGFIVPVYFWIRGPEEPMIGITSRQALEECTSLIEELKCGLQVRVMLPEYAELPIWLAKLSDKTANFNQEPYEHIDGSNYGMRIIITDRDNAIRAYTLLSIRHAYNGRVFLRPYNIVSAITKYADISPLLSLAAAVAIAG